MQYFLLIVGFALLTYAADLLVSGASALARRLHISDLVIGLTVVAFGTSAPEFIVNLLASLNGSNEIAFTNILGSNCINVFVILGLCALIFPLPTQKITFITQVPLNILAALLVGLLGLDLLRLGPTQGLSTADGLVLLVFFGLFLHHTYRSAHARITEPHAPKQQNPQPETGKKPSLPRALLCIALGLAGLLLGGHWVVNAAVKLATAWGVSDAVIGATIVALGTSLPELATSVAAALRKNADIAIGNIIGSNIFNVFWILGLSATIHPIQSYPGLPTDVIFTLAGSLMVFIFLLLSPRRTLSRLSGAALLAVYALYLCLILH